MAQYLKSRPGTPIVESMLYMSPDEADEFKSPLGTFSIQVHFDNDPVSPSMRLEGVTAYMNFTSINGKKAGMNMAHGSTPTTAAIDKIKSVLKLMGGGLSNLLTSGSKWDVTETKNGYHFERVKEEE